MSDMNPDNKSVIAEFRPSEGRAGGIFEGEPMVLVHHLGRKSGQEYVNPLMYLPGENDDSIYVFASKGGAPTHPDWYHNLGAAGEATIEVGSSTYPVTVSELTVTTATLSTPSRSGACPASASTRRRPRASAPSRCWN